MTGRPGRFAEDTSVAEDRSTVRMAGRIDSNRRLRLARCPVGRVKASAVPGSSVPVGPIAERVTAVRDIPVGQSARTARYGVRFRPKREVAADNWDIPAAAPARECQ